MMVIIAERIHLFPFRTQQLSSHTSTIFGWRRPEKIDRCHQPYVANSIKTVCDFFVKKFVTINKEVSFLNLFRRFDDLLKIVKTSYVFLSMYLFDFSVQYLTSPPPYDILHIVKGDK